jgi:RNA polymerase sigma factor (sigma-70 family)
VLHAQNMQNLRRALDRLTPMQRAIVLLHRRDGMTYEEISRHVGTSVPMVNKHLIKSLALCRKLLGNVGGPE